MSDKFFKFFNNKYLAKNAQGVEFKDKASDFSQYISVSGRHPKLPSQFATKAYVDSIARGIVANTIVQQASVQPIDLTKQVEGGDDLDGKVVRTNDLIIVKDQADATENGVYKINSSDEPERVNATEVKAGNIYFVDDGETNNEKFFQVYGAFTGPNKTPNYGIDEIHFIELDVNFEDEENNPLDFKQSVLVASDINIDISNPGSMIDSITLSLGDRILLRNQINPSENGIYTYNGSGNHLTRSADADSDDEVTNGLFVYVEQGTDTGTAWVISTPNPIVLDTTPITFVQFSGTGSLPSNLINLNNLSPDDDNFIVGNGTEWVTEQPPLIRNRLQLVPGVHIQEWDEDLDDISNLSHTAGNIIQSDGTNWISVPLNVGTTVSVQTTDATPTLLTNIELEEDSIVLFELKLNAYRVGGTAGSTGDCGSFIKTGRVFRTGSAQVEVKDIQSSYHSVDQVWSIDFTPNNEFLDIDVTGAANNTVEWEGTLTLTRLNT